MTKKCPKCLEHCPDEAGYCGNCGYKFNSDRSSKQNNFKKKVDTDNFFSNGKIFLVAIVLILIIGSVLILSTFSNTNVESVPEENHIEVTISKVTGSFYDWIPEYNLKTEAIFTKIPDDITGYMLKTTYFDKDYTILTQETVLLSDLIMKYEIKETTSTETFADVEINGNVTPTYVTVDIIDDGKIITSDNYTIDKNKID